MKIFTSLQHFIFSFAVLVLMINQISPSKAWSWSISQDDVAKSTDVDNVEETEGSSSGTNAQFEVDGEVLEEEDVENEQNLRCSQHFNRNLYRILKSIMPANSTERKSRQDDTDTDPNELVQSMLNLEFSQIIGPVLRIVGSAAAANATAIDENYNSLPLAVRYQVNDFIKFTVDLLTTV